MQHGFGFGLRPAYYRELSNATGFLPDCLELLTEDFLTDGGPDLAAVEELAKRYPCILHGVSLSIGSTAPLDLAYLDAVAKLANRIKPLWISDHFCWTGVNGVNLHDLMPLPYTSECVNHLVMRISQVQQRLGQQIVLENISSYVSYHQSTMSEWAFITEVATQADCLLLLDINNIYVNSINFRFDPYEFLNAIPIERVQQLHLAGHQDCGDHMIDTHDQPIVASVWELYEKAIQRFPHAMVIIERDSEIPPLQELWQEVEKAKSLAGVLL